MAIVSVKELWQERKHVAFDDGRRRYERYFQVLTDNQYDTSIKVKLATGIPRLYAAYNTGTEIDTGARAREINATQDSDTPYKWIVSVIYESLSADSANLGTGGINPETGQPSQPSERPSIITFRTVKEIRASRFAYRLDNDILGDLPEPPFVNSSGEFFDDGFPYEIVDIEITIEKNKLTFNFQDISDYVGYTNLTPFLNCPAETLYLSDISAVKQFEENQAYWKVTYVFIYRPGGWFPWKVLDAGYSVLVNGVRVPIKDPIDDSQVGKPQLLNGAGKLLPQGAEPVYLDFRRYVAVDFTPLGLP